MQYFSSSANFLAFVLIMFFSMRFPGVKVSRMIFYVWKAYFVHIKRLYSLDLWLHYNHFEILVFSLSTKGFQNSTLYSSIYIINKDKIIFLILHTTSHFIQYGLSYFIMLTCVSTLMNETSLKPSRSLPQSTKFARITIF